LTFGEFRFVGAGLEKLEVVSGMFGDAF